MPRSVARLPGAERVEGEALRHEGVEAVGERRRHVRGEGRELDLHDRLHVVRRMEHRDVREIGVSARPEEHHAVRTDAAGGRGRALGGHGRIVAVVVRGRGRRAAEAQGGKGSEEGEDERETHGSRCDRTRVGVPIDCFLSSISLAYDAQKVPWIPTLPGPTAIDGPLLGAVK